MNKYKKLAMNTMVFAIGSFREIVFPGNPHHPVLFRPAVQHTYCCRIALKNPIRKGIYNILPHFIPLSK